MRISSSTRDAALRRSTSVRVRPPLSTLCTRKWPEARATFAKLEKFKAFLPDALYGQAWAAFNQDDVKAAMDLSKRAIEVGHRTDAMFLYGDSLFRNNEAERAKAVYVSLRKRLTGDLKATAIHKIVACNQKLHLADTDGTTD